MEIGNRIIFDHDGEIIAQLGEMQGDVLPRKEIKGLDFIDLEHGEIDYSKYRLVGIDLDMKKPILEEIEISKTPEQERIEELESQLLLMADELEGGIL